MGAQWNFFPVEQKAPPGRSGEASSMKARRTIAAFYKSVSDLSQRHGGELVKVLRKKAPACDRGLGSVQADQHLATLAGLADYALELRDPP